MMSPACLSGPAGLRTTAGVHLHAGFKHSLDCDASVVRRPLETAGGEAAVPGNSHSDTVLVSPVVFTGIYSPSSRGNTEYYLLMKSETRDVQVEAPHETGGEWPNNLDVSLIALSSL